GVMAEAWDGRVGSIGRIGLPAGDEFGSKICTAWEAATGDAGWGGHLADLFAKSPLRPVCILFAPGQDVFRLVEEAIALLPPAARWNVTFNTYFTSMPTSATCLWRCCLAGTQAAQVGLRYAATGLILDLTDRSRLPALPGGPYVNMARTGQPVELPRAAAAPKPQPVAPRGGGIKLPPVREAEPEPPEPPAEDISPSPSFPEFEDTFDPREGSSAATIGGYALQGTPPAEPATPGSRAPARIMRRAEDALEAAEREAAESARRRRKQVMLLFCAAIAAIGVGTALVFLLNSRGAPPEPPGKGPVVKNPPVPTDAAVAPDQSQPAAQTVTAQTAETTAVPRRQVAETGPAVPPVPAATYPDVIVTQAMLERPNIGAGIGDRVQMLALKRADIDPAAEKPETEVTFAFPPTQTSKSPAPAKAATYVNDSLGTLTAQSMVSAGKPGIRLLWKGPNDPSAEAAFIGFDRGGGAGPGLEVRWKSSLLLKNPGSFSLMFWTLQNSVFQLETPRAKKQQIVLKPFVPAPVSFVDAETALSWPVEFPKDTTAAAPAAETLPAGWKAEWYPDWESKDPTQRKADNALQVIKFKKAGGGLMDPWFLITFSPGLKQVTSTYMKRIDADKRDLAQAESDLRAVDKLIEEMKARQAGMGNIVIPPEEQKRRDEAAALVEAYKAAVAGYNEISKFDIALGLADGMQFTTLHFEARGGETGK
ncbi:MAG TPA: hypothetical protein VHM90_07285, partial [Phycisphaerae bacterium]|nr:hypothetical protein [Phycisphaerae bacterium]